MLFLKTRAIQSYFNNPISFTEGPAIFIHPLSDMSVKEGAPAILHAEVNKLRYQQSGASVNITW